MAQTTKIAISPDSLKENAIKLIGTDWMLITAGNPDSYNMMTASWGGLGFLWGRPVAYVFIRPHRYTYEFMEKNALFTLSFFDEEFRDVLNRCGSESGRDINKMSLRGLTAEIMPGGSVTFAQARLCLECRKLYHQDIYPVNFHDPAIQDWYPQKDYHRMYIGEIVNCLIATPPNPASK